MKQENYGKTDNGQTESIQAYFEHMTPNFVHGLIVRNKIAFLFL